MDNRRLPRPAISVRSTSTFKPTLTLCIAVYKGGRYWQECWESVKPLADLFDKIQVSINYSEFQPQDIAVLDTPPRPENLRLIVRPKFLSAVEHFLSYIDYLDTDYAFLLAHDDWLLKDGVEEVLAYLQQFAQQLVAVFGSHAWIETDTSYSGISRELAAAPEGVSTDDFVLSDIDNFLAINVSGLVTPVKAMKRCKPMMGMFAEGFRGDNFVVTYPGITRVLQTFQPSVKIRLHAQQAGAFLNLKNRAIDNTTYYFVQALYGSDPFFVARAIEQVMLCPFRYRQPYAIWQILKLLIASTRWEGYKRYGLMLRCLPRATATFFANRTYRHPLEEQPPLLGDVGT
jgi:hypothetical protein